MSSAILTAPRRLNGRALLAGRLLFTLLLLLCIGIFSVSLYAKYIQGTSSCDSIYNADWEEFWCTGWFETLEELGLTATAFESYFLALRIVATLPYVALSVILVWRRGQELRILLLASFLMVLGTAGTLFNPFWEWGGYWLKEYSQLPFLSWTTQLLTFLLLGGGLLFTLVFPDGRFVPRWSRWPAGAWLLLLIGYVFFPETKASYDNWPFPLWTLVPLALFLLAMGAIILRYRRQATAVQRQQIKWITAGFLLLGANFLLDFSVFNIYEALSGEYPLATPRQAVLWELGQDSLWYFSQFLLAICIGLAVFRNRLWDIDPILNRTLVYGGLTAAIIALYVLIVGGLGALFQIQTNAVTGLVATGIIAVFFQPLRDRLQRGVNRLLYGERDDPAAVLTQLAQELESAPASDAILPTLVETIALSLKIPHAAIWVPTPEGKMEPAAVWGRTPAHVERVPLNYQNGTVGQLVVAPRGSQERFNRAEERLLSTIAALTASTVRAVQLSDELRRSRRRIVTTREEERRRLRRDLHDGLGPQLASQTLGLEAIEQLLPTDPEKAHAVLSSLKSQAQEAILDVRRLVYDLRPPALDDLGLVGALRQSATRYETGTLRFSFDVPELLPELPAAVETAAYRITQEAMTNVVRHAQATAATVHLYQGEGQLVVEVSDNGQGLNPDGSMGVGLQSMRERAAELNGRCVIESPAEGGTRVQAKLPLEVSDE